MTDDAEAVRIPLEFYFDYNCPFCYVASERLDRLAGRHPLAVHYRFIETHPRAPASGIPRGQLDQPAEQRQRTEAALDALVREDDLPLAGHILVTNTRRALVLAQAVVDERPESFWSLHRGLFRAAFAQGCNLGDPDVLRGVARFAGVDDLVDPAWESSAYVARLLEHVEAAQENGLTEVPTLVVGGRAFPGAVSVDTLEDALSRSR